MTLRALFCVLADGKSGAPGAGEASAVACRETIARALTHSPRQLRRPKTWLRILEAADAAVLGEPDAGLSTLIGACITGRNVVGASNGDSAAFLVLNGGHYELTGDQVKNPPVGSGSAAFASFAVPLGSQWRLFFMSDGVWDHRGLEHTVQQLDNGKFGPAVIENLQTSGRPADTGRFRDDFTVLLVQDPRS